VAQEAQRRLAELAGDGEALDGAEAGVAEGLLEVDLGGAAGVAGDAAGGDLGDDALAVPAAAQCVGPDVGVGAVVGVAEAFGDVGDAQGGEFAEAGVDAAADGVAASVPVGELAELDAADGGLDLEHAPVGAEGFVDVAEAGRVVAFVDGLVALAVVLVGPGGAPPALVVHGEEAAFAAGGDDLVLAETEGGEVAEGAHGPAVDGGALGLGAVFDDGDAVGAGEVHEVGQVDGPAAEVDGDDRLGAGGEVGLHRGCIQVAAVAVDVGEHRRGAAHDGGGGGRDEGAGGGDDLVAGADAEGYQGELERLGAVVQGDGVVAAEVGGVLGCRSSSSSCPRRGRAARTRARRERGGARGRWEFGSRRTTSCLQSTEKHRGPLLDPASAGC